MEICEIKVVYLENYGGKTLEYKHRGDSGFDLYASNDEQVVLAPLQRAIIPSGCKFLIPEGLELQVRPRGGTALKGLTVANTPGTVDSCFRGEVGIIAVNLSDKEFVINRGDRIAQAVIAPVVKANLIPVEEKELDDTTRGEGAYNSTGTN